MPRFFARQLMKSGMDDHSERLTEPTRAAGVVPHPKTGG